ncbi:MAG: gamma-glutamyl-gamma-aminobutyrate hydrolase family protein [Candidatus Cloacimonetes bacterium]|nr:gamma-glutamyl-gamma-aminobutyrate hydrolase family protein [Candidatus Cloacimonadota bacterium]
MILILNTITNAEFRTMFHGCIRDKIYPRYKVRDLGIGENSGDLSNYTHLIISGSSLSTVTGSPFEAGFMEVIDHFYEHDKAILGICYGHQLLAKYLGGEQKVRKAVQPQFGFRRIELENNPLFKDITEIYSMVAHFDEVADLDSHYKIIAKDNEGVIQGYQYSGRRLWGIQFHPEYDYFSGYASWQRKLRNNPKWIKFYQNEVPSYTLTSDNSKVFSNFIGL